ncbi:MAG TPA: outer membrane beta-barrel protein [Cellvibrio sp.]|nr:outer membrane beta-barrel protein [Cellvibrio sp.]
MKKIIGSLTLIAASLASNMAAADSYWGVGLSNYDLNINVLSNDLTFNTKAIEGVFGIEVNDYVSWEARAGFGLSDDQATLEYGYYSTGITSKTNSYFSGYFKPHAGNKNIQAYGLLGYSSISHTVEILGSEEDTADDGVSYGLGAEIFISGNNTLNFEWKQLAKIDGGEITGVTFAIHHRF